MAEWSGRSRLLGMPIRSTSYEIRGNKLFLRRGYISNNEEQVLLHRVLDISLREDIIGKLCHQGTLILTTSDVNNEIVILYNIENPREVRDMLNDIVEKERERHGVNKREFIGYAHIGGRD